MNVVFTVTDRHGRYVKNLAKSDFSVLDDSKPAEQIRSFHNETDLPLQVGLLVDASNSVRDRFKFEQESAIEFLNQTIRPRYDKAFVVGFDVTPEVTQDFTDNTEALSRGVRALRPGGGTAMYDALYFACRDKLLKEPRNGPVRRAIILLSDGDDNMSHVTREEAIEMAQRAEVIVYTISTNISGGARHSGDKVLERIADATGGRAFFPFQLNDVANAFVEIQDELRSQYALSYNPADSADGRPLPHHRDPGAKPQRPARPQPPRLLRAHPVGRCMAGYSGTPLPKKLGLKPQFRVAFFQLPSDVKAELKEALSDCVLLKDGKDGSGQLDFAMIFVKSQADMKEQFPALARRLAPAGMLWVSWPKKASGVVTDIGENEVMKIGLTAGLVDVKVCAVNESLVGSEVRDPSERPGPLK